jgi:exodeoxyribonuclease-5
MKAKPGRNGTPPVFRLFGYAGTGKTTLARHIADGVDGEVKFAAFTGKAALVMRNKGCDNASTIHSLIYRARESGVEQPSFELWDDAPASKAKLIVIDECSMVDAELGRDLMSFDCPLLVLGDPAQLPPIQGGGFFTDSEPDAKPTRCWSGATTPAAPTTCGYGRSRTSRIPCRSPATSWCACATTARRVCSTAGCGG